MASLRLGDTAPDFTAQTTQGEINFHEWLGDSWGILFSHPSDFTPVCTTELGAMSRIKDEFDKRNTKILAVSVDPVDSHHDWIKDINETQNTVVEYPIIADENRKVAELYDMIHPNADSQHTVRSVFVISPDKKIKLTLTYPPSTGRNFDEILRVVEGVPWAEEEQVAAPVNWVHGEEVVIGGSVSDEEAAKRFPGYRTVKPYLRLTKLDKSN